MMITHYTRYLATCHKKLVPLLTRASQQRQKSQRAGKPKPHRPRSLDVIAAEKQAKAYEAKLALYTAQVEKERARKKAEDDEFKRLLNDVVNKGGRVTKGNENKIIRELVTLWNKDSLALEGGDFDLILPPDDPWHQLELKQWETQHSMIATKALLYKCAVLVSGEDRAGLMLGLWQLHFRIVEMQHFGRHTAWMHRKHPAYAALEPFTKLRAVNGILLEMVIYTEVNETIRGSDQMWAHHEESPIFPLIKWVPKSNRTGKQLLSKSMRYYLSRTNKFIDRFELQVAKDGSDMFYWEEIATLAPFHRFKSSLNPVSRRFFRLRYYFKGLLESTREDLDGFIGGSRLEEFWDEFRRLQVKLSVTYLQLGHLLKEYEILVHRRLTAWRKRCEETGDFESVKPHLTFLEMKNSDYRFIGVKEFQEYRQMLRYQKRMCIDLEAQIDEALGTPKATGERNSHKEADGTKSFRRATGKLDSEQDGIIRKYFAKTPE